MWSADPRTCTSGSKGRCIFDYTAVARIFWAKSHPILGSCRLPSRLPSCRRAFTLWYLHAGRSMASSWPLAAWPWPAKVYIYNSWSVSCITVARFILSKVVNNTWWLLIEYRSMDLILLPQWSVAPFDLNRILDWYGWAIRSLHHQQTASQAER